MSTGAALCGKLRISKHWPVPITYLWAPSTHRPPRRVPGAPTVHVRPLVSGSATSASPPSCVANSSRSRAAWRLTTADFRIDGHVDVASVQTGNAIRDRRLRSEFFDTESYPSISLQARANKGDRRLLGELSIRGVTRTVELGLTVDADPHGALRLRAEGKIQRSDFGLEWEPLCEAGQLLVADEVRLRLTSY